MSKNNLSKDSEPERLKIDDVSWTDAMRKAIKQEKVKEGWPEPEKNSNKDEG